MGTTAYSSQAQVQTAQTAAQQASATKFNNIPFTSEPATRPSYIPNDVNRGGVTYHVIYHDNGYGYYNNGLWIALAAADMASMQQPVIMTTPNAVVVHHGGGLLLTIFIVLFVLAVISAVFFIVMRNA